MSHSAAMKASKVLFSFETEQRAQVDGDPIDLTAVLEAAGVSVPESMSFIVRVERGSQLAGSPVVLVRALVSESARV